MIKKSFIILCTAVCILSCSKKAEQAKIEDKQIHEDFITTIKTVPAQLSRQQESLTLTGKVEYDPDRIINYVSLINGVVDKTYFSLGDKVNKGQKLIDLRSTELSMLRSELISLSSDIKIAERELATAKALYEDNMLSEKELIEAQETLNQYLASLERIETDMSLYGYNKEDGSFSINAPMTGYIVGKNVSSGSNVAGEGESLFTIADLSTVWITLNVYAGNLLSVKEGMEVDITTLSYPDEIFTGKINTISQVFDPEERVLKARIIMPNEDLKFKPEMTVVVRLKNTSDARLITIPSDAVVFEDNSYYVIVRKPTDEFEVREVVLYSQNNGTTYIQSGLAEREEIVTVNQLLLYSELK